MEIPDEQLKTDNINSVNQNKLRYIRNNYGLDYFDWLISECYSESFDESGEIFNYFEELNYFSDGSDGLDEQRSYRKDIQWWEDSDPYLP